MLSLTILFLFVCKCMATNEARKSCSDAYLPKNVLGGYKKSSVSVTDIKKALEDNKDMLDSTQNNLLTNGFYVEEVYELNDNPTVEPRYFVDLKPKGLYGAADACVWFDSNGYFQIKNSPYETTTLIVNPTVVPKNDVPQFRYSCADTNIPDTKGLIGGWKKQTTDFVKAEDIRKALVNSVAKLSDLQKDLLIKGFTVEDVYTQATYPVNYFVDLKIKNSLGSPDACVQFNNQNMFSIGNSLYPNQITKDNDVNYLKHSKNTQKPKSTNDVTARKIPDGIKDLLGKYIQH